MKFHLSTMLLAMVIVALGLGWYLDHNDPRRTEIVGTWHFPYQAYPMGILGHSTSLTFNEDGTFSKCVMGRSISETYEGTYTVEEHVSVLLHVTKKTKQTEFDEIDDELFKKSNLPLPERTQMLDVLFRIRCAVDKAGYLVVQEIHVRTEKPEECKAHFAETYERLK